MRATLQTKDKASPSALPSFAPFRRGLLQGKCACGGTPSPTGECAECKKKKRLQSKLIIGASNDPLEQEADRVAEQVLAVPAHNALSSPPPRIQRFTGQVTERATTAPDSVDSVLANPGRPLDTTLRQDMESRFSCDFSRVRVHSGAVAEQSAQDVNAHAYTVGHNIVFGAGRFAPETHEGRRLIAHELTHVAQQSGSDQIVHSIAHLSPLSIVQRQTKSTKCTDAEVTRLNTRMHVSCNKPRGCSVQSDSCATATAKVAAGNSCVRARTELQQKCFSFGDQGYPNHMERIAKDSATLRECIAVMTSKCAIEAALAAALAAAAAKAAADAAKAAEAAEAAEVAEAAEAVEAVEGGVTLLEVLEGLALLLAL